MLKYFRFFIDECAIFNERRTQQQAQTEWDAMLNWKMDEDKMPLMHEAFAMGAQQRLGAGSPAWLAEVVNSGILEEPEMHRELFGTGPPAAAGDYRTNYYTRGSGAGSRQY